jgi:acyl-CoA synthetase (AMP-forming)/AMP-acid ligase II
VTPAELEGALCSSSLVADAGVCGIPDPARASEKPRGWIVLSEEGQRLPRHRLADALRKETEAKLIRYKWVTGNVRIVDVIPKSVAGKSTSMVCYAAEMRADGTNSLVRRAEGPLRDQADRLLRRRDLKALPGEDLELYAENGQRLGEARL